MPRRHISWVVYSPPLFYSFYIVQNMTSLITMKMSCEHQLRQPSLCALHLLLQLTQPLHQPTRHIIRQTQYPIPRDNPIRSARLEIPASFCEPAIAINFDTPNDILRPRYAPVVRRIPQVTNMYPTTMTCSSSATLLICTARPIAARCFSKKCTTW